ncbi:uncharacterized protein MKK02DRAFT_21530 [Dioszegia hungarica]|uniref:TATA box binding protein associated factor (TAF) histone-like fold domain-containing protein n=1 Tax=Dioszegia hungarica TaxID=4972 RepID=A0AA38H120_9TREE|nr:uncharacterized protein MKK02DRAFT_21530 [Dioszegia hungarica]KAI9631731.1 hypothetical protein MKK02DRAFT_21530 [Dioszegia hungarica]
MAPSQMMGIYPVDSIVEASHSLALDPLGPGAADLLASDVEYRIHLIIQEARKFMINGKRQTLTPEDIEYAMEALNVEPILVPPRSLPSGPFAAVPIPSASGGTNHIYHVPDEEIDFASFLKKPLPTGVANSAGVSWKAHWLAVEGVQPAVPENPAPNAKAGPSRQPPVPQTGPPSLRASAKSTLPQELQVYFTRLTAALVPSLSAAPGPLPGQLDADGNLPDAERHRQAALASVKEDQAMAGVLVYFVKWLSESVGRCLLGTMGTLGCLVDCLGAILGNESVFLEPYIHQLLPPILSIILAVPLGPQAGSAQPSGPQPSPYDIRSRAADVLGMVARQYGAGYPGLIPRLVSTLKSALDSSPSHTGSLAHPAGRYEGAVLGLTALGASVVRETIWAPAGNGLKKIDGLCGALYPEAVAGKGKGRGLVKATEAALQKLLRSTNPDSKPSAPATTPEAIAEAFGQNLVVIMTKKRAGLGNEMIRLREEELARSGGLTGAKVEAGGAGGDVEMI